LTTASYVTFTRVQLTAILYPATASRRGLSEVPNQQVYLQESMYSCGMIHVTERLAWRGVFGFPPLFVTARVGQVVAAAVVALFSVATVCARDLLLCDICGRLANQTAAQTECGRQSP
jgi:hypothetical protein